MRITAWISIFSFSIFFIQDIKAQNFNWAVSMGGTTNAYTPSDAGNSIMTDATGNVYTTGSFAGVVDFDPGPGVFNLTSTNVQYGTDMFIQKLDSNGNFVWAKQLTGDSNSAGTKLMVDASFNIYITGWFWGTKDFDPGPGIFNITSAGNGDIFILKLTMNGDFLWAKILGGNQSERGTAITIDNNQNVYIAGIFKGTADFDPGAGVYNLTSAGDYDIFITKLDNAGNFVWAGRTGNTGWDRVESIVLDANANVYTTGSFNGTCDFDPGSGVFNLTSLGADIFIWKLSTTGNFIWAKQMVATTIFGSIGFGLVLDNANNIFYCGEFTGTVDFDPGQGSYVLTSVNATSDIIISKLDEDGNFKWAKQIGGNSGQNAWAIALDAAANCYTTGTYANTVDFDPGPGVHILTANFWDVYIEKLDSSGNFMNVITFGGSGAEDGFGIIINPNLNIYTTGTFRNTVDFDPGPGVFNLTSNGGEDIFIQKLSQCAIPVSPGSISGNTSVCQGSSQTYSINPVTGANSYTWLIPSGWTGSSTTTSINVMVGTNSGNISVSANNSCGNSIPQTLAVTVNPIPAQPGTINGNNSVCQGSSQTYFIGAVSGATSYTWTLPSGWTGASTTTSITVAVGANSGNISVTANNICGSSIPRILAVTTSTAAPPQPGTITGNSSVCQGSSQIYSISPVSSATSYSWTLPTGWTGSSSTTSITATVGANSGNISVTANNVCGVSTPQTLGVTVTAIPAQPGTITGNNPVCNGSSQTYSVSLVSGATSYSWTLPTGWTGTSTTNSITLIVGTNAGNISVTANNSCGNSPAQTLAIIVSTAPPQPGTISGNTSPCSGSSQTYSVSSVSGATSYNWILPTGWTGTSTTNSITVTVGASSGSISVTANNSCGNSIAQTLATIVNSAPLQPGTITGNTMVNVGQNLNYSIGAVSGATGYNWVLNGGGTITAGQNTTSISINWTTTGNYTISVNAYNNCGTSNNQTMNVTVSIATAIIDPISGYKIKLTPNPTTRIIYLKAQGMVNKQMTIQLIDLLGQPVYTTEQRANSNDHSFLIDLGKLAAGMYQVKIFVDKKVYVRTIMKL